MKIHFLGTAASQGFPNVFCRCEACLAARSGKNIRTRASVIADDTLKFDYSADSQMQALRDRIDLGRMEHLLWIHGNDLVMYQARQALGKFGLV